jgi:hypothetical protein
VSEFVITAKGVAHRMRDLETTECGRGLHDGTRSETAPKLGRCRHCENALALRAKLIARAGGERRKMRVIRELSEIVNRQEEE